MRKPDDKCNKLSKCRKNEFCSRYNTSDLFFDDYDDNDWLVPSIEVGKNVPPIPPQEGDEEEKEGTESKYELQTNY